MAEEARRSRTTAALLAGGTISLALPLLVLLYLRWNESRTLQGQRKDSPVFERRETEQKKVTPPLAPAPPSDKPFVAAAPSIPAKSAPGPAPAGGNSSLDFIKGNKDYFQDPSPAAVSGKPDPAATRKLESRLAAKISAETERIKKDGAGILAKTRPGCTRKERADCFREYLEGRPPRSAAALQEAAVLAASLALREAREKPASRAFAPLTHADLLLDSIDAVEADRLLAKDLSPKGPGEEAAAARIAEEEAARLSAALWKLLGLAARTLETAAAEAAPRRSGEERRRWERRYEAARAHWEKARETRRGLLALARPSEGDAAAAPPPLGEAAPARKPFAAPKLSPGKGFMGMKGPRGSEEASSGDDAGPGDMRQLLENLPPGAENNPEIRKLLQGN